MIKTTIQEAETSTPVNSQKAVDEVIIDAIQDLKGSKIADINLEHLESAPAHRFIVCQGKSTTQVSSIADKIQEEVRLRCGLKPYCVDGYRNSQWIVIDYGSVMAHVFLPEFREIFNLEELWSDADIRILPD